MPRHLTYSDADLALAVQASHSIAGVLRELGIKPAGGSHAHNSKRIKRLDLNTSHFLGQGHNAGSHRPRLRAEQILVKVPGDYPRRKPHLLRRAMLESGVPYECSQCRVPAIWNGKALLLHVDHIDGDPSDCRIENLRFLCPNCHSQTATYCRKGRSSVGVGLF